MSKENSLKQCSTFNKGNLEQNPASDEYYSIISSLKRGFDKNMVSYMDSDINKLFQFCEKNQEFLPTKTVDEFKEVCNSLLSIIWGSSNPKDEMDRILRPRLPDTKR